MTPLHTSRRTWTAGLDETGALVVVRPDGARWYPNLDAEREAGEDMARLIEICRRQPDRGTWA